MSGEVSRAVVFVWVDGRKPVRDRHHRIQTCTILARDKEITTDITHVIRTHNDYRITVVNPVPEAKHENHENSPVLPGNYPVIRSQGCPLIRILFRILL